MSISSFQQFDIKHAKEVLFYPVITSPTFAKTGVKVIEDIQSRLVIYESTKFDKVTRKRNGCGLPNSSNSFFDVIAKAIEVVDMQAYIEQCADVFYSTIYETSLKKGVDINDLTDTDIEELIQGNMASTVERDLHRILWFGDNTLNNQNYNAFDGWFKRIRFLVSLSSIPNYTISAMTQPSDAYNALLNVYKNQLRSLKSVPNEQKKFLVTRNIYDLYTTYLSTLNGSESAYFNIVNGIQAPTFMGIPVIVMDIWDEYFLADFTNSFNNGRIILHHSENSLYAGMDASSDATTFKAWYSLDDDKYKMLCRYKAGTELGFSENLSVGGFN